MNPPPTRRGRRIRLVAAVATLFVLTGCGSVPSSIEGWARDSASIGVTGLGEVTVSPDTMTANVGVAASSADVAAAMRDADSRRRSVADALIRAGVDRRDVAEVGVALTPQNGPLGDVGAPSGYLAVDSLRVTIRDLAAASRLLDLALTVGGAGARVDSVGYAVADGTAVVAEARARAYRNAHAQAEQWAALMGNELGPRLLDLLYEDNGDAVTLRLAPRGTLPAELTLRPGQHTVVTTVALEWQLI